MVKQSIEGFRVLCLVDSYPGFLMGVFHTLYIFTEPNRLGFQARHG